MTEVAENAAGEDLVRRHGGLGRRTALVSVLTLVSRVLGFVREVISAALFGDRSPVFDAFITAWRVPNLFRRFLGEGALSTSFQTALTRVEGDEGRDAGVRLFRSTFLVLFWILVGVCALVVLGVLAVPDRMPGTGWAWLGADPEPVRDLTARVMPFVVLACLAALAGGALHVRGRFAAPAWAPVAMNLVWIVTLLAIAVHFGWAVPGEGGDVSGRHLAMTRWLAIGVLAAGVVQLAVHWPALVREGFFRRRVPPAPTRPGHETALTVLKRSAPLALGAAVYQINVMVDGLMAEGLLANGGPTLHYYANRIQQFPMALIAIAATSAVFPALQAHGHRGDMRAVRDLHDQTHCAIAFVALPASVGLFVLAEPVIAVSFERGAFGAEGVARATAGLRMLTLSILPAGAVGLVARTYYALGDFRTPVVVASWMLVANAILNLVFIMGLGMDVDGLALGTAVTSWASLVLLLPGLRRRLHLPSPDVAFVRPFAAMVVAALGSGAGAGVVHALLAERRAVALATAIAAGILIYVVLASALRIPESGLLSRRPGRPRDGR